MRKIPSPKLNKAIKISEISWTHSYSPITDVDLCQVPNESRVILLANLLKLTIDIILLRIFF